MEINVINNYGDISFDYQNIIDNVTKAFLKLFDIKKEATIILVNDEEIRNINNTYRHIDKVTDVISFEEEQYDYSDNDYLGEIFIDIDRAILQAKEYCHSIEREFAFLCCHGMLHINGYDHIKKEDEVIMFELQDKLLDMAGYKR